MVEADISVESVESFLKARRKTLAFTPQLERRYELDTRARRSQRLKAHSLVHLLLYNVFLGADVVLVPDQLGLAVFIHLVIVSPLILAFILWLKPDRPRYLREGGAAAMSLLVILQILVVFCASQSPHSEDYQYLVMLSLLNAATTLRLPFHYAAITAGCAVGWHWVAVLASGHLELPVALMACAMVAGGAYSTVVASFSLERDARRSYLHTLLDRLRLERSNAASRHDALTGLANRRLLEERLAELWDDNDDSPWQVAAVLLDVDYFKSFNDNYGHVAGDVCLKRVAACIVAELRDERDLATRFGGEEILLLLPGTDLGGAIRVAERIRRAIEALALPHKEGGARQIVTASFGVASVPVKTLTSSELIAAADMALYAAKRNGRNQVWPSPLRSAAATASDLVALPRAGRN